MAAKKTIRVRQVRSPQRREASQRATLVGLGLNKISKRARAGGHSVRARHDRARSATWSRS